MRDNGLRSHVPLVIRSVDQRTARFHARICDGHELTWNSNHILVFVDIPKAGEYLWKLRWVGSLWNSCRRIFN